MRGVAPCRILRTAWLPCRTAVSGERQVRRDPNDEAARANVSNLSSKRLEFVLDSCCLNTCFNEVKRTIDLLGMTIYVTHRDI